MKACISLIIIFMIWSQIAIAGNIAGKVLDQKTKWPLAGVNIVVDGTQNGAASDEQGFFIIKNLNPGSYNVRFIYLGYKNVLKSNIIVNPEKTTVIEVSMPEELLEGQTIEVSGSYFEKAKEAVVSTRSMDFEEIRRSPGAALDIQRVMQALPAVVSGTDQNNEIIIRGGIPGENLFLMDNIEIPNPNHFGEQGTGGGPINMLNTYMVRKVDFYAGAFSAKYGDKASSVMDITLRDATEDKFAGEIEMGMAGAGILAEGKLPSVKTNYLFSARKSFLDLIISSTGLVAVPRYYNLQSRIAYEINPQNQLIFNAVFGDDKINIENEGTGGYSRGAENVDYSGIQYAGGLTWKGFWSKYLYSVTTLSTTRNDWEIDVYRSKDKTNYFINNSVEDEHTLKTDISALPHKTLELNFGGSYKSVSFDHNLWAREDTIFYYDEKTGDSSIFRAYPSWADNIQNTSYKTALYTQIAWDMLPHIRLTAGGRLDHFEYNGYTSGSPRLGFSFMLDPQTTFNLAFGRHYQSPSYLQLTLNPLNRKLKSKYTEQFVAGIEKMFREDIKFTVEAFYKNYFNVPVSRSLTTADPYDNFQNQLLNKGEGYAKGIEFFLQKKLTKNYSTIISYSNSVSQAKDPRTGDYYNWDYDFRNVFTFIGGYKTQLQDKEWYREMKEKLWYKIFAWILPFADEVEASIKLRYLGGRPYTPPVYHPEIRKWVVEETQRLNTARYPEYHRLDFRLDRRYFFDNWNMIVYFDMMNVYGRDNIWEYQYNSDGTREKILQFQVFPVGGFAIEF